VTDEVFQTLRDALALDGSRVSVRAPGAIAEVYGPLDARRGAEWLTLGTEGGSHVHLKLSEVAALGFSAPADANAALEVLARDGARLCRVSFARTNRSKTEHDAARLAEVCRRFGHLAAPEPPRPREPKRG
jgi:hypothetical protein